MSIQYESGGMTDRQFKVFLRLIKLSLCEIEKIFDTDPEKAKEKLQEVIDILKE